MCTLFSTSWHDCFFSPGPEMLQNSMPTWLSTLLKSTCSSLSISVNMADANLCVWKLRCVSPIVSNLTSRTYTLLQVSQSASCVDSFIHLFEVVVFYYSMFSCLLCPAEIRYNLTLDALRAKARASFIDLDDKSDRRITRSFTIKDREIKCVQETFMMSASTLIFFRITWA